MWFHLLHNLVVFGEVWFRVNAAQENNSQHQDPSLKADHSWAWDVELHFDLFGWKRFDILYLIFWILLNIVVEYTIYRSWCISIDEMSLIYLWRSLSLSTSRSLSCWAWASLRWYWACSSDRSSSAFRVTVARRSIRSSHSLRACVSLWDADSSSSFTRALNMHRKVYF